jgi:hypothetical protein
MAVNKNTDDIYIERIHFDQSEFDKLMARAERIITAAEPPLRLRDDPTYFICKWCEYAGICHGTEAPLVNCRTCAHSTADIERDNATWTCTCGTDRALVTLPIDHQRQSHDCHRYIPALLQNFADYTGTEDGENPQYKHRTTGLQFGNGTPPINYTSDEIRACEDKRILGDAGLNDLRATFDGRIAA